MKKRKAKRLGLNVVQRKNDIRIIRASLLALLLFVVTVKAQADIIGMMRFI